MRGRETEREREEKQREDRRESMDRHVRKITSIVVSRQALANIHNQQIEHFYIHRNFTHWKQDL